MRKTWLVVPLLFWALGASAQELRPSPGTAAPALELPGVDGRIHRLEAYRGKVVLINFWASWCEPCREEMPSIETLRRSLNGEPFVVLAVNVGEGAQAARRFADAVQLGAALLLDRDGATANAWGARALPSTFIVGPDGTIRYRYVGALDWSSPDVRRAITGLMPRRPSLQSASALR
ncbi:MAG: TlpA disulfide reductase family protein [Burkholderiales bacterium]